MAALLCCVTPPPCFTSFFLSFFLSSSFLHSFFLPVFVFLPEAGGGGYSGGGGGTHTHGVGGGGGSYIAAVVANPSLFTGATAGVWRDGMVIFKRNALSYEKWTAQKSFRLTNCGQEGRTGPSHSQCQNAYQNSDWRGFYKSTTNGVQQITFPADGRYRIEAVGARGGYAYLTSTSYWYGYGAKVWGEFDFKAGTKLSIVVGQNGNYRPNVAGGSHGGAGGGGTFVWLTDDADLPLLVAGGGGGASYGSTSYRGLNAPLSEDGLSASPYGGIGGFSGFAGTGSSQSGAGFGGGGGGWLSDGSSPYFDKVNGKGKPGGFLGGEQMNLGYLEGGKI